MVGALPDSPATMAPAWGLDHVFRTVRAKAVAEMGVVAPVATVHPASLALRNLAFVARWMVALHRVTGVYAAVTVVAARVVVVARVSAAKMASVSEIHARGSSVGRVASV